MRGIEHSLYIKARADEIYSILTTTDGWNAWFTDETTLELSDDGSGEIRLQWTNVGSEKKRMEDGGKILKAVYNKAFVFQWSPGDSITTVSMELTPHVDGTTVTVKDTGYTSSEKDTAACIHCAAGWGEALLLLKIYVEHGIVYKHDLR
ncbi:SRPBCC domain-containing protein [Fictibacillus iocasae]|uniref:SRPBCC domain-containing protein n=1 Tax=Fictibacillus iocasae TaxID=2715437 RepID=A0ABW2NZV0_9BACL